MEGIREQGCLSLGHRRIHSPIRPSSRLNGEPTAGEEPPRPAWPQPLTGRQGVSVALCWDAK